MRIELLIRKDESRQAGAVRVCAAGFVAIVMGVLLIFSVFSGEAMACGGDPPPDCPPCSTPDGQGGCIPGCTCPCEGCLPGVGCYEDCPTGENCCCPGGWCYNPNEKSCCGSGLCDLDECEKCVDGVCVDRCTYYYADWCMICDGAGYCISRCEDDECCDDGICKGPICDNCHSISDTTYECGHYASSTNCASDWCIIDVLDTVTCDYHPDSPCPSYCKVEAVVGQPAVLQRKVIMDSPTCLTGGEPVQYEDWHTTYQGCGTCSIQTWRTSCETFGCPGTEEYTAPRGNKMTCAGTCP